MGDVAMLQVAVGRLRELWPTARIDVITGAPDALGAYCPGVTPVSAAARYAWVADDYLLGPAHRLIPGAAQRRLGALKRQVGHRWPGLASSVLATKAWIRNTPQVNPTEFVAALHEADLFVVCGLGGLTDSAKVHSRLMLNTVEAAARRGIPVALFSQGVGPWQDAELLARAGAVLPRAMLIAVREPRWARKRLESVGVAAERIVETGDDAVELAYQGRRDVIGEALGVNLRVAPYAGVEAASIPELAAVFSRFAKSRRAALVPLPITRHRHAADAATLRALVTDGTSDGGVDLDTPQKLIEQASRCRMVVAGAYHAAVFALAQGIPAVCLAGSDYYRDKFDGLVDLFGPGCRVVEIGSRGAAALERTLEQMWDEAERHRPRLLASAQRQVAEGRRAYRHLADLQRLSTV